MTVYVVHGQTNRVITIRFILYIDWIILDYTAQYKFGFFGYSVSQSAADRSAMNLFWPVSWIRSYSVHNRNIFFFYLTYKLSS